MLPLPAQYSFTDFARLWAAETGTDLVRVSVEIASAIAQNQLTPELHDSDYPSTDHHPDFLDDPRVHDFAIQLDEHIRRVAVGIDPPDFDGRLRQVGLPRAQVKRWLGACGHEMPRFWRASGRKREAPVMPAVAADSTAGGDADKSLQKIVALLVLLLAETKARYKCGDKPNATQIHRDIVALLDAPKSDLRDMLGTRGLSRSIFSEKISEALKLFEKKR